MRMKERLDKRMKRTFLAGMLFVGALSLGTYVSGIGSAVYAEEEQETASEITEAVEEPVVTNVFTQDTSPNIMWYVNGLTGDITDATVTVSEKKNGEVVRSESGEVKTWGLLRDEEGIIFNTVILFDNSLSMDAENRGTAKDLVKGLIDAHVEGEEFILYTFDEKQRRIADGTDYENLKQKVDEIKFQDQKSYMLESTYSVLEYLKGGDARYYDRIILISDGAADADGDGDGDEEYCKKLMANIEDKLKDEQWFCQIYTIRLEKKAKEDGRTAGLERMKRLSERTQAKSFALDDLEAGEGEKKDVSSYVEAIEQDHDARFVMFDVPRSMRDASNRPITLELHTDTAENPIVLERVGKMPRKSEDDAEEENAGDAVQNPSDTDTGTGTGTGIGTSTDSSADADADIGSETGAEEPAEETESAISQEPDTAEGRDPVEIIDDDEDPQGEDSNGEGSEGDGGTESFPIWPIALLIVAAAAVLLTVIWLIMIRKKKQKGDELPIPPADAGLPNGGNGADNAGLPNGGNGAASIDLRGRGAFAGGGSQMTGAPNAGSAGYRMPDSPGGGDIKPTGNLWGDGPKVVLRELGGSGRRFEASLNGEIVIGRSPQCTISLSEDRRATRRHCRIFVQNGYVYVEDLGSTNGTTINGKAIYSEQRLMQGDVLQVGSTQLQVERI